MAEVASDTTKAKARQDLLAMAKEWEKEKGRTHHAIEAYERIIGTAPASTEADQARGALLEIAKRFEEQGKKYSAYHLYKKVAYGKEGISKKPL